ncbi:MAG TPA: tyrosine--tRNA ligase [Acidimicrobiales bacterium]|nr:tyrosine--tRNA ligase [Acidimicrobiales bacterium]
MATLSEDLRFRGLIHQISDDSLLDALDAGGLTVYIGFDPSFTSLHMGNLLQLCNLRRFQEGGHRPIVLAGGATGMIGDPGGRREERHLLDQEQLAHNLAGITPQLQRFLDFSEEAGERRAVLVNNADWIASLSFIDFLRDVGKHFTVNQMVAKESVRSRLERQEQGISYTEFSYMLIQAYDFLHLFDEYGCTLQMGASDQWGNITMGIDLVRRTRAESVFALTSPLVLKSDGTKFGKSEDGALYLDANLTSPFELYQYFVRLEDEVVGTYLRFFTFMSHDTILELDRQTKIRPQDRVAQRELAREIVELVHGEDERVRVERAVEALYGESICELDAKTLLLALDGAPSSTLKRSDLDAGKIDMVDVLVQSGLVNSKNIARQTLAQGGAYVNNRRVDANTSVLSPDALIAGRYLLIRRGRRDLHLLDFD